ncbi:hypothetical protein ElyMa_005246800 [Elysia marginata]|uniref:Uncharacterized protein n=1 Tax=Elysia marginata TaxID=1093978 RepID=A0AAV4JWN4_9GAST|nr:hypothetical protein ElyMa_005246800 [Elysia marginata]
MRLLEPAEPTLSREQSGNLYRLTGVSNNDNLCHSAAVRPKTATVIYPQYDVDPPCPPNRFKPLPSLPREIKRFNASFEKRQLKFEPLIYLQTHRCCVPHLPPAYRPVLPVPPAEFWTHVDLCNPWHFFDRSACCDRARPYTWENDICPTPYCRPGGEATEPLVIPYPNLGLYFPPCENFQVKC